MGRTEKQNVSRRRWNWFLLFCLPLALVLIADGTGLDKPVGKRRQRQEAPFEERLEAEQRLSDLGYWTGPVDGALDPAFRHALVAFQKVEGRKRTGLLTNDELLVLRAATRPIPQDWSHAHIEIDLGRQALFLVDRSGSVTHILPVCTGNEKSYVDHGQIHRAHTPRGRFQVLRKISGWRLSSLGLLYYPNYIQGGLRFMAAWRWRSIQPATVASGYQCSPPKS